MKKCRAIQEMCSEILYNPTALGQKLVDHLSMSAGLIEHDITQEGCDDWFERSSSEAARFIREKVSSCSERTLDDVYFLLLEMSVTFH